jgi:predicted transcriptional regulator
MKNSSEGIVSTNLSYEIKRTVRRRNKLEIYHDILHAIMEDLSYDSPKLTRVQLHTNLSYDKFSKHLDDLEKKKMIQKEPLSLTNSAREFLNEYDTIKGFIDKWIK